MYKACIFDLDGTLTDTLESLTFSVNETLKEVALPAITEEQCRTFVGNGAKVLIEQSLKAAGDTKLLLFEKAFEAYGLCARNSPLFPFFDPARSRLLSPLPDYV